MKNYTIIFALFLAMVMMFTVVVLAQSNDSNPQINSITVTKVDSDSAILLNVQTADALTTSADSGGSSASVILKPANGSYWIFCRLNNTGGDGAFGGACNVPQTSSDATATTAVTDWIVEYIAINNTESGKSAVYGKDALAGRVFYINSEINGDKRRRAAIFRFPPPTPTPTVEPTP